MAVVLTVFLLPFFLFTPALPRSHAQRVRAHLSADTVKVGERFTLSLVAEHSFMQQAHFPSADTFGDLVVIGRRDSSYRYLGAAQPGARLDSIAYEVTTFALDTARVPSLAVAFVQNADTTRVSSPERRLAVRSVLPPAVRAGRDTAGRKPMTPPVSFPRPLWPWLLLGAGVLTLLAVLAYVFWRRRRAQEEHAPAAQSSAPPVPPGASARRRLRRLEATTDFDDPDAAKPFFSELADILRRYLMHRLGIRAYRSTTAEVLAALDRRTAHGRLPHRAAEHIRAALRPADLAKFADQRPPASPRRDALTEARAAIDAIEDALRPAPSADGEAGDEADEESQAPTSATTDS